MLLFSPTSLYRMMVRAPPPTTHRSQGGGEANHLQLQSSMAHHSKGGGEVKHHVRSLRALSSRIDPTRYTTNSGFVLPIEERPCNHLSEQRQNYEQAIEEWNQTHVILAYRTFKYSQTHLLTCSTGPHGSRSASPCCSKAQGINIAIN